MAEGESDICHLNTSSTDADEAFGGPSVVDILQIEIISREVLKYLKLADLKACTLVCQSISWIAKCYIRDHFIIYAKFPPSSSPCTALASLESALDQIDIVQFNGLRIRINDKCSEHPADSPLIHMAGDLYPNILSRVILKRLFIQFRAKTDTICWMATKFIEKLLDKNVENLKHLIVDSMGGGRELNLLKLIHGERIFTKLSYLKLKSCFLDENETNYVPVRTAFFSSVPNLEKIYTNSRSSFPSSEHFRFVKKYLVSSSNNSTVQDLREMTGDSLKLSFLKVVTTKLDRRNMDSWKKRYGHEMEYLMQRSCDSLRKMAIKGEEFPQFSKLNIPPMTNLRHLHIKYTLEDPWFLTELAKLCALLPGLDSVDLYHSPCRENHNSLDLPKDGIVPSAAVSVLRIEGFDGELDILMSIFAKFFPNLKELQVYDCDSSALGYTFLWPQLECLALCGKNSHWNGNFDHLLIGFSEEEMHQWLDGADAVVNPTSLMTLKSLRRLYLIGGGLLSQDYSSALLSPLAMSCLMKNLPKLAVRILPGFNESVLSHLVTFDNAHDTLWCPLHPFDIEGLFYITAVSFVNQRSQEDFD